MFRGDLMKRLIAILSMFIFVTMLVACGTTSDKKGAAKDGDSNPTFIGTIEEITDASALVSIEEGNILNSGTKVMVDLSVAEGLTFNEGDRIKVTYDGIVRETHPLGINTVKVELLE